MAMTQRISQANAATSRLTGIRTALTLLVATASLLPVAGHAQQTADLEPSVVFFDLYFRDAAGAKTPEYVTAVQDDIRRHKTYSVLARTDAGDRLKTQMITPAKRVNAERLKSIEKMVQEGDKLAYTNPKQAIEVLRQAKEELKELVEHVSLDEKIRRDYFTTQMLLVTSHMENENEPKAREIMVEIVRVFEDENPVTTKDYHPRVVELYKEVFRSLQAERTASLTVTTNPPGCDVFINGRPLRQKTPFTFEGLYPGPLRINVRKGDLQSMVRKVEVPANGSGKIDIDLEYESALSFAGEAFGLTFTDEASLKANVLNYTEKLGKFLEVDYIMLVGVVNRNGSPVLAGYQVDVKARTVVRQQDFAVKANVVSTRRVEEMSAFLAGKDLSLASGGVIYKPWYKNWIGWTLAGSAVALGSVAAVLGTQYFDARDNATDPSYGSEADRNSEAERARDLELQTGILAGIGGAALVGSILVFTLVQFEDEEAMSFGPSDPRFIAFPWATGDGGGLSATLTF